MKSKMYNCIYVTYVCIYVHIISTHTYKHIYIIYGNHLYMLKREEEVRGVNFALLQQMEQLIVKQSWTHIHEETTYFDFYSL